MARSSSPLALVPSSLTEANQLLVKIGVCERALAEHKSQYDATVAILRDNLNSAAAPLEAELKRLIASVKAYATAHREVLLEGKKKSVVLSGGEFGWRTSPAKVTFGRGGESKALATVINLNLVEYQRVVTTLNKEALLENRPAIPGVKYTQAEKFFVKPTSEKAPETFPGQAPGQKQSL